MCAFDQTLVQDTEYAQNGCPSFSLGYYIGRMRNDKDCNQIDETDLTYAMSVSNKPKLHRNKLFVKYLHRNEIDFLTTPSCVKKNKKSRDSAPF